MNKKLLAKLCGLNFGLAILNILFFSDMFLGISLTEGNPVFRALGYTLILMSVLLFCYGNFRLLRSPEAKYDYTTMELNTPSDLIDALEGLRGKTALRPQLETAKHQVEQLGHKKEGLRAVIYHKFREQDEDALGFQDVVENTEKLLYGNVKKIINAASVFDQKEFQRINPNVQLERFAVYREQIDYIRQRVAQNEQILLEYDRLLMEVSKLEDGSSADETDLEVLRSVVDNLRGM